MDLHQALGQEWAQLQHDHEQYERSGLLIKLLAVVLCLACMALGFDALWLAPVLLMLWLQEGIYRAFQSRLSARLLRVEQALAQGTTATARAFQLHSDWLATRPGTVGLIREYLSNAARPTVAFPYVLLLALSLLYQYGP
ncbi:hypothetical protein [Roseateles toxinivorans]|uniref:Uncharacterized protein n=1 Tax=Roseateles toxinivorans TaxID=270368 RepID=A0A4R6QR12_9BURK|nr:hypothetical protein [Roseateles toxinivorans]TDP72919.1 hypothetical protein DES47_102665 [Roseateles toxinivorans]